MAVPVSHVTRILLIVLLAVSAAGCELVGGIFKAGIWVGAIGIILIVVLIMVVAGKMKR
ncbi:MAG TPA: hypothetical protein VF239_03695 [Vicinamibacterales bacterium]|jgi:hypothetical protein